jgi:hypothetical protein
MSTLALEGLTEICNKRETTLSSENIETLMTLHGIKPRKTFVWKEYFFNHANIKIKKKLKTYVQ